MQKKRKISIILEVAVFFLISVLTIGLLTRASEHMQSDTMVIEQTEQRASQIGNEVKMAVEEYPAYKWLLRYWYTHADEMDIEYDVTYSDVTETERKALDFKERHTGYELKYLTETEIRMMAQEDQKIYAEIAYSWLITRINEIKRAYHIDYLFCVASRDPYDTQFFLFSGAEENAVRGTEYEQVYPLGHVVTVSESQQRAMKEARKDLSYLADAGMYVDYYTYLCSFDSNSVFIGMTYSLEDLITISEKQARTAILYAVLNQLALSLLCLVFVYFVVLRPLKGVQKNIRLYRETKDSDTVRHNLERIRPGNELGQLSEDVSDLAAEMDSYMERIRSITAEKERITTELTLASRIQEDMLPNTFPAFPNRKEFDIYASMTPAKEVGGDFYDFFLIDVDHLCIVIADVSGKGVPAALFMMASKIILANNAMMGKSPAQILMDTNAAICANNREEMFVTCWLGILEISTGKLTAANAGHEYPALKPGGAGFELVKDKHGFVLGGMDGVKYKEYEMILTPGTKLFVYTDGVPEASDADHGMFGTDRMISALNEDPEAPPAQILQSVRDAVEEFVKDAEQFDDLTMLCMVYNGK